MTYYRTAYGKQGSTQGAAPARPVTRAPMKRGTRVRWLGAGLTGPAWYTGKLLAIQDGVARVAWRGIVERLDARRLERANDTGPDERRVPLKRESKQRVSARRTTWAARKPKARQAGVKAGNAKPFGGVCRCQRCDR